MTVIRFRCEHRPSARTAIAGVSPRADFSGATRAPMPFVPRALTWSEQDCSGASDRSMSDARASALPEPPSSGNRVTRALEGLRILLVEDDDDARELVSIIFANAGAVVQCAASASDGFRVVYESQPQVLVSDIGMPDEDGYSLMRRVRALECSQGGDIPAIALSAFTRPEDRMLALRAGFTMHIAKPVHPTDLVSAVASLAALMKPCERYLS
jgi:CheY-like chemotaxis protein